MPTALRTGPYRIFFYSGDRDEPPHVHVERDASTAKFWLDPVRLDRAGGFKSAESRRIQELIEENQVELLRSWHEYFGS
jgi:uncharacterized protein DUF4160